MIRGFFNTGSILGKRLLMRQLCVYVKNVRKCDIFVSLCLSMTFIMCK